MRRAILAICVASGLMLAGATKASAQPMGFGVGYFDLGPVIGVGGLGSASVSIGGRAEYGIKALPDLGNGVLSIAASFDHYSFNDFCNGCGFSFTPIGATVNYHFHLDNKQWDPFLGLGLGDLIVSNSGCAGFATACGNASASGIYFIGRAGIRYFVNSNIAAYVDAGSGEGALHFGIMFKLKGQ